jgi:hypothetical protein
MTKVLYMKCEIITLIGVMQNKINSLRTFSRISSNFDTKRVTLLLSNREVNISILVLKSDFHE